MSKIVVEKYALAETCAILKKGGVVAIPTETVYGLAADARNQEALARVFSIKKRPQYNPLILHVSSLDMAQRLAFFNPIAQTLAKSFWPGPLSLVLPYKFDCGMHPLALGGLLTVAIRMPCGFALDLIKQFGSPLAAPSANFSGKISATNAQMVKDALGGSVDLIVDGGKTSLGLESTIVKIEDQSVTMLRPGMIPGNQIEKVLGFSLKTSLEQNIQAPGMMKAHYAPQKKIRLHAEEVFSGEALLAFGSKRIKNFSLATMMHNLSAKGDVLEAASNLFYYLYLLDQSEATTIVVEPIPMVEYGEVIHDRLMRAAAKKEI